MRDCIVPILGVSFLGTLAPASAQTQREGVVTFEIRLTAAIQPNPRASHHFAPPRDSRLTEYMTKEVAASLGRRLDQAHNRAVAVLLPPDPWRSAGANGRRYVARCELSVDNNDVFHVGFEIRHADDSTLVLRSSPRSLTASELRVELADLRLEASDPRVDAALRLLAARANDVIGDGLYRWVTESTVRLRVIVQPFTALIGAEAPDLRLLLQRAVEAELSQSAAVSVQLLASGSSRPDSGASRPGANYRIEGDYSFLGAQLRIDIRCVKTGQEVDDRLLTSRYAVLNTIDAEHVSNAVTGLAHELRYAMEADFSNSVKTLAVVATAGTQTFALRPPRHRDLIAVQEIMRATALKLRLLTAPPNPVLDLQVLSNPTDALKYTSRRSSPGEILADLQANYLLLLTYQDLGTRVRLTADLHSYDVERPAVGVLVAEVESDLSDLNDSLDVVIGRLVQRFRDLEIARDDAGDMLPRLRQIRMEGVDRPHRVALRMGVPLARHSPALFLGRQSGLYFEASYAIRPGFMRLGKAGGRLDGGIDIVFGLESTTLVGSYLSFNGPSVTTVLLNGTLTLTPWEYSATNLNMTVGAGFGMQSLRYNLRPGDLDYTGTAVYRQLGATFAVDGFANIHFPVPYLRGMEMDVLTRWLPGVREITEFRSLPLARFASGEGPTGKLGGLYVMGGLSYVF